MRYLEQPLGIVVVGASGDLARKKIFPALFALYCQDLLPREFAVYGFSRTQFSDEEFRKRIMEHLTCRYTPGESCAERMDEFLSRCRYVSGQYDSPESFGRLDAVIREQGDTCNRMYYLAIPPDVFLDVAGSLRAAGPVPGGEDSPWARVVIEKPFGRDRTSSDALARGLAEVFAENQTYRIDHYLGKELIQNLMVLRFANLVFEPIWSNLYISRIQISWREDIGIENRGGYFDQYGIVRDVMQNHLLQMLALLTMEAPNDLRLGVRDEKVKVLRSIDPVRLDELVLGQYAAGNGHPGYRDEEGIDPDSKTATYAATCLHVRNRRWEGVPFLLRAGKGVDKRCAEIRVEFKSVPGNIFSECKDNTLPPNELVIRVQPDEAIYLKIMNKVPGLGMELAASELDLRYAAAFDAVIPDAYENLLLDVLKGDRSLFIREDELAASWDIFTPVLHQLDEEGVAPEPYAFGSAGPEGAVKMAHKYRSVWR